MARVWGTLVGALLAASLSSTAAIGNGLLAIDMGHEFIKVRPTRGACG
jgi:hypothetical protein